MTRTLNGSPRLLRSPLPKRAFGISARGPHPRRGTRGTSFGTERRGVNPGAGRRKYETGGAQALQHLVDTAQCGLDVRLAGVESGENRIPSLRDEATTRASLSRAAISAGSTQAGDGDDGRALCIVKGRGELQVSATQPLDQQIGESPVVLEYAIDPDSRRNSIERDSPSAQPYAIVLNSDRRRWRIVSRSARRSHMSSWLRNPTNPGASTVCRWGARY